MKNNKKIIIGIIILIIILSFFGNRFFSTGKSINTQEIEIIPLSIAEKEKVIQTLLSSEFIKDMPKKESISLRFFNSENGQRIWQDGFLIGKDQLLSEGTPAIYLSLHSKYISEFNQENLCEVIKRANANRDLGFYSEDSKTKLFFKYSSMLKHRGCFGF
ncbi:hypothetical protein CMI39_03715 [Candidatus Pacearchaeota archaeon]|nr:hypothetical protein [Candidatus Pacearchaeota archaeon]|tara:strand:- start:259 stop:738 length:480 start_codon:yes stop_codon:yes gene_type:complete